VELFEKPPFEFVKQIPFEANFKQEIQKLPYIFSDTHQLDKKVDVKKLQFGSKIDQESVTAKEEFYAVKEVISPALIKLNNDLIIRLIGVREEENQNEKAVTFLREKTKGKKVFLRFDKVKHDSENHLFAYLYLQNKTFLNAHLVKKGFTLVDESIDFKYKTKFLKFVDSTSHARPPH
jgi:modification methylase